MIVPSCVLDPSLRWRLDHEDRTLWAGQLVELREAAALHEIDDRGVFVGVEHEAVENEPLAAYLDPGDMHLIEINDRNHASVPPSRTFGLRRFRTVFKVGGASGSRSAYRTMTHATMPRTTATIASQKR